jgi:hypothetical protein
MKFRSMPMKSRCARNNRHIESALLLLLALGAISALAFFVSVSPQREFPVGIAGAAQWIDDEDAVALLSLGLGGRDMAAVAWSAMNPSEKQALRDQAALIDSMAQAAEREGLLASPDVERAVRWGKNAFLADAWEKKVTTETDLSDEAVRAFYETNLQRYNVPGAVRYRHVTYPSGQKKAAEGAKKSLRKASLDTLKGCVTVDWTEYDVLPPALAGALGSAPLGKVMGPVEVPGGHVLYEVLERRKEEPTLFEKCRDQVKSDLIQIAIKEKLESLEKLP